MFFHRRFGQHKQLSDKPSCAQCTDLCVSRRQLPGSHLRNRSPHKTITCRQLRQAALGCSALRSTSSSQSPQVMGVKQTRVPTASVFNGRFYQALKVNKCSLGGDGGGRERSMLCWQSPFQAWHHPSQHYLSLHMENLQWSHRGFKNISHVPFTPGELFKFPSNLKKKKHPLKNKASSITTKHCR